MTLMSGRQRMWTRRRWWAEEWGLMGTVGLGLLLLLLKPQLICSKLERMRNPSSELCGDDTSTEAMCWGPGTEFCPVTVEAAGL